MWLISKIQRWWLNRKFRKALKNPAKLGEIVGTAIMERYRYNQFKRDVMGPDLYPKHILSLVNPQSLARGMKVKP